MAAGDDVGSHPYRTGLSKGKQALNRGDHDTAARYLRAAAEAGNKEAQFWLAGLHLDGLGVEEDTGMAYVWISVAAEGRIERFEPVRDRIAEKLTEEERKALKPKVREYIGRYGTEAQNVVCRRQRAHGSMRARSRAMRCEKERD